MSKYSGLQKAIRRVGDIARFARSIKVTVATVNMWLKEDGTEAPPETRPQDSAVTEAVEKAGSAAELARQLKVSGQAVGIWLRQGFVPQGRAKEIEMLYGIDRARLVSPKVRSLMGINPEAEL